MILFIEEKEKTNFLIRGGDIFPKESQVAPERKKKKKIKAFPTPFSNVISGIPFEESWVFTQEVQSIGQDSATPGNYNLLQQGQEGPWH